MIGKIIFRTLIGLALIGASQVYAQQYPTKVITMIIPFSAGGPTDTVGRLVARAMGASLNGSSPQEKQGNVI